MRRRPESPRRRDVRSWGAATFVLSATLLASACAGPAPSNQVTTSPGSAVAVASSTPRASAVPSSVPPSANAPTPRPTLPLLGAIPAKTFAEARATALQAVLEDMVRSGAPDAIAAVVTEEGSWAGAAGIAGAKGRKATSEDEFAIASITKTFTAALVLRLAEQGRMDLDEPLASYMGDLKVDTNGATVRQALEMRSGLADYPQPAAANHIRLDAAHSWTAEEMVAEMDPPIAAAGETLPVLECGVRAPGPRCRTCDRHVVRLRAAGRSWSTRGTSAGSSDKDPNARRPSRGLCRSPATSSPGRQRTSALAARSAASRRRRTGPVRARSPATLRPSRPGSGTCSPATSCPRPRWDLWLPPGNGFAYGLESAPYGRGSIGASGGKTGYGAQFTMFPRDHAVIVIFVNDPDSSWNRRSRRSWRRRPHPDPAGPSSPRDSTRQGSIR